MTATERKEQIRKLWQICFDDTEEFVEFYFDKVYQDDNAVSIEKDGRIVSVLQMVPYVMTWCGAEITVAYISGACTAPEERGKGLMGELLHKAFHEMRRKEYDITALIPATPSLFEFYRKYDYTEAFDYSLHTYQCPAMPAGMSNTPFISLDNEPGEQWYLFFDSKLRERPCCILHSRDDFHHIIMDTHLDGGIVTGIVDSDGKPAGIAFVTATEKEVFIKEMIYTDDGVKEKLLLKAADSFHIPRVIYKTPPLLQNALPYGMARIVNKEKMIWQWLDYHPNTPLSAEELSLMDAQALTRNLLGYGQREAYMSLMLD